MKFRASGQCPMCGKFMSRGGVNTSEPEDGVFCSEQHRNQYIEMMRTGGKSRRWIEAGDMGKRTASDDT